MFRIIQKSLKKGTVTGEYPVSAQPVPEVSIPTQIKVTPLCRSLSIREIDTGSCNACEMEMNALMNPIYDAERFGIHIAASPRHADALVISGPVTFNMEKALKDAYRTTPAPKVIIALGDCAIDCGAFKDSYAVTGPVDKHLPVDVKIPGCPPRPNEILDALLFVLGRRDSKLK